MRRHAFVTESDYAFRRLQEPVALDPARLPRAGSFSLQPSLGGPSTASKGRSGRPRAEGIARPDGAAVRRPAPAAVYQRKHGVFALTLLPSDAAISCFYRFLRPIREYFMINACNMRGGTMRESIVRILADESGATAIEYGLIAALISVAAIAAMTNVGNNLRTIFNDVASNLNT